MFKISKVFVGLIALCAWLVACVPNFFGSPASTIPKKNPQKVFVHFMPVGNAKPFSSNPGWSIWTFNGTCNPDVILPSGRRDICVKQYPKTGPYDFLDPDVMEYQTLLMRLSGIDGVFFDYRAPVPPRDLSVAPSISQDPAFAMTQWLERAGLKFGFVLEDNQLRGDAKNFGFDRMDYAQNQMFPYLQRNYFSRDSYLKFKERPILLSWGPTFFQFSYQKQRMFSGLSVKPWWVTLDWGSETADAGFFWTPNVDQNETIDAGYQRYFAEVSKRKWSFTVSSAFPGFDDTFDPAHPAPWQTKKLGFIDFRNGQTFAQTLDWARRTQPDILQLVTWNDYVENTVIEPTEEHGNLYLEQLQDFTGVPYAKDDLNLPLRLFHLRKKNASDKVMKAKLDQVFALVSKDHILEARSLLDSLEAK